MHEIMHGWSLSAWPAIEAVLSPPTLVPCSPSGDRILMARGVTKRSAVAARSPAPIPLQVTLYPHLPPWFPFAIGDQSLPARERDQEVVSVPHSN